MPVSVEQTARAVSLAKGGLTVAVTLDPFRIRIDRRGATLIDGLTLSTQPGRGHDRLIHLTEGVIVEEQRGEQAPIGDARVIETGPSGLELEAETPQGMARIAVQLSAPDQVDLLLHDFYHTLLV